MLRVDSGLTPALDIAAVWAAGVCFAKTTSMVMANQVSLVEVLIATMTMLE